MEDSKDPIIDELIMKYLDGELSPSELEEFNTKRKNDNAFDKSVNDYILLVQNIKANEREKIKEQIIFASDHNSKKAVTNLKTEQKTINMTNQNHKKKSLLPLLAAAAVAILVAGYFWSNSGGLNTDEIFNNNYKQQVAFVDDDLKALANQNKVSRSGTPEDTMTVVWNGERILKIEFEKIETERRNKLILGINNFKKSKWTESVGVLANYVEAYNAPAEDQTKALFYLAKARLNASQYAKAADTYNKFIELAEDQKAMTDEAEWDRAMCYIQIDQSKVKTYLEQMAGDNGHAHQDDAKGLISYFE